MAKKKLSMLEKIIWRTVIDPDLYGTGAIVYGVVLHQEGCPAEKGKPCTCNCGVHLYKSKEELEATEGIKYQGDQDAEVKKA